MAAPDLGRFFQMVVVVGVFSVAACASEDDAPAAVTSDGEASSVEQLKRTAAAGDREASTTEQGDVQSTPPQVPEAMPADVARPASRTEAVATLPEEPRLAETSGLAGQVREQLEAQGWVPSATDGGAVDYRQPQPQPQPPAAPAPPSLAEQVSGQLEGQGWQVSTARDGSRIYVPPGGQQEPQRTHDEVADNGPTIAGDLRRQLLDLGWTAIRAADGSMIYRKPTARRPAAAPTLADDIRQQLEQQGWTAERAADGSMIYYKPTAALPASAPTLAEDIRRQLEQQGWQVTVDEDGSRIYRAAGKAPDIDSRSDKEAGTDKSRLGPELRAALEAKGWTMSRSPDGGIFLLPPKRDAIRGPTQGYRKRPPLNLPDGPALVPRASARLLADPAAAEIANRPDAGNALQRRAEPVRRPGNRATWSGTRANASYTDWGRAGAIPAPHIGRTPYGWRTPAYPQHPPIQRYGPTPGWMPPPWAAPPPGAYGYRR